MAPADIGDGTDARKIERLEDRARLGSGLLRQIGGEQRALLGVARARQSRNAHAEDLLEGRLARLEVATRLAQGRQYCSTTIWAFSARREGEPDRSDMAAGVSANVPSGSSSQMPMLHEPAQEAVEMRRRQAERLGQSLGGPGLRRQPVGQAELHRGIDQRRLVIGLDLPAQPRPRSLLDLSSWRASWSQ